MQNATNKNVNRINNKSQPQQRKRRKIDFETKFAMRNVTTKCCKIFCSDFAVDCCFCCCRENHVQFIIIAIVVIAVVGIRVINYDF